MTDQLRGASLYRRLVHEHRRAIVPLAVLFVANVLVWVLLVRPLADRVANVEQRNTAAERSLTDARREHDNARGALTGKEQATVELATFYNDILPSDLAGARRLTYLRLAQMVREAGLSFKTSDYQTEVDRDSTLRRLRIQLEVQGNWENIRALIYQLDTAPEFVVIDNIVLSEGQQEGGALELSMALSTYYRTNQP